MFITGCGRSGTTLMFELLKESVELALDEPRELYLNGWGKDFDIWSVKSKERAGKIIPTIVKEIYLPGIKNYLEKMPEHIFRIP